MQDRHYTLAELLAACDDKQPPSTDVLNWLNMVPVALEFGAHTDDGDHAEVTAAPSSPPV